MAMLAFVVAAVCVSAAVAAPLAKQESNCTFCVSGGAQTFRFDLSSLPTATFATTNGYSIASPCQVADPPEPCVEVRDSPILQGCRSLGSLANATTTLLSPGSGNGGFNITMYNGSNVPPCGTTGYRSLTMSFVCDKSVPATNGPETTVVEWPSCHYNAVWRHPSACGAPVSAGTCAPPIPPAPKPESCDTCHPTWKPTWDMKRSTILYACNSSGYHDVEEAISYGVAVYDWSNGKAIWANAKPMTDEELLTKQAEMVLAADPGIPGEQPRVWVYRNTIKALNWYTSVRVKLDNPAYAGWFYRFKDYKGPQSNHSYHVPACTYEKCSGFYHDQEQTPEYPRGDGSCLQECDCGVAPCGEYIFDHRNNSFADWFINEYMISNETLFHKGVSLGWLDDSMKLTGPTEEDTHFINDTGLSAAEMQASVAAYQKNIRTLQKKVVSLGGFYWQMIRGQVPEIRNATGRRARNVTTAECVAKLKEFCVDSPPMWGQAQLYQVDGADALSQAVQYTSEFLLTRGPYAWLGFGWQGCSSARRPRPAEWDVDYGTPEGACKQQSGTNTFVREWTKATVSWDCNTGTGKIDQH
eukprot:m.482796 g.482796  ORF g.482796 m.482796 type:complete len:583 (-) comp22669_c0_seq1:268-2016(-)